MCAVVETEDKLTEVERRRKPKYVKGLVGDEELSEEEKQWTRETQAERKALIEGAVLRKEVILGGWTASNSDEAGKGRGGVYLRGYFNALGARYDLTFLRFTREPAPRWTRK